LEWNMGIVNYGALFPDLGYVAGPFCLGGDAERKWAEVVHDSGHISYLPGVDPLNQRRRPLPPFRAALITQMRDHINSGLAGDGEGEKMIAFLFGLIAHQEADIPWHWCLDDENCRPRGLEAAAPQGFNELAMDEIVYYYDKDNPINFDFFDMVKADIAAASAAAGRPAPCCSEGWHLYDPLWMGDNCLQKGWDQAFLFSHPDPNWRFIWDHKPGGIEDGAKLIAVAWKETWDMLTGRPEVASVRISGPTEGEPGQYTFTAAFEPEDAIRPLSWAWDNGDTTKWTARELTAGTHTLQATAKGWKESTLATASHTITINAGPTPPPPPPPTPPPAQWVGSVRQNLGGSTPTLRVESAIAVVVTGRPGLVVDIQSGGWTATCTTGNKPEYGPNACEFGGLRASTYTITPRGLGAGVPVTVDGVGWALVQFDPVK
jgi:hypothetical protein